MCLLNIGFFRQCEKQNVKQEFRLVSENFQIETSQHDDIQVKIFKIIEILETSHHKSQKEYNKQSQNKQLKKILAIIKLIMRFQKWFCIFPGFGHQVRGIMNNNQQIYKHLNKKNGFVESIIINWSYTNYIRLLTNDNLKLNQTIKMQGGRYFIQNVFYQQYKDSKNKGNFLKKYFNSIIKIY